MTGGEAVTAKPKDKANIGKSRHRRRVAGTRHTTPRPETGWARLGCLGLGQVVVAQSTSKSTSRPWAAPGREGGISRGERDSALWPLCRSSERSIASKPTSLFSSSFKVEMECTTTSDLGRIENEQTLPSLADLPPFQMPSFNLSLQPHDYECALRFRGIQGPRESSRGDGSWQTATEKKGGGAKSRDGGKKVERGGEARKGC